MNIVDVGREHAGSILAIFNEAILASTALYDYKPRTLASMGPWFDEKVRGEFPVIGILDDTGRLVAFGSYGVFRARPANKYTVEHSVYVDKSQRGNGYGRAILTELIQRARSQDYHCMIAAIDSENTVSIALHEKLGFEKCGELRQVGFKFGRWLDLVFLQRILDTPLHPNED